MAQDLYLSRYVQSQVNFATHFTEIVVASICGILMDCDHESWVYVADQGLVVFIQKLSESV